MSVLRRGFLRGAAACVVAAMLACAASAKERQVGLFYFLWLGEHGKLRLYDNSIISQVPGVLDSEENWMAAVA